MSQNLFILDPVMRSQGFEMGTVIEVGTCPLDRGGGSSTSGKYGDSRASVRENYGNIELSRTTILQR